MVKATILLSIIALLVAILIIVSCSGLTTENITLYETQTITPSFNKTSTQETTTTNSSLPTNALNQEEANLTNSIRLATYYNVKNGYYIDYPVSWFVDETNSDVVIIEGKHYQDTMMITVGNLDSIEFEQYVEDKVLWFVLGSWEIDIVQKVYFYYENYPAIKIDFNYFIVEDDDMYWARAYFIIRNDKIYQLFTSANQPDFLYDPISSFHFQ